MDYTPAPMSFPALVLPERWLTAKLGDFDPARFEPIRSDLSRFCTAMNEGRPDEGSGEEKRLLGEYLRLGTRLSLRRNALLPARDGIDEGLHELFVREHEAREIERRFALRQLAQALELYGLHVEGAFADEEFVDADYVERWLETLAADVLAGQRRLDEGSWRFLRFEVALLVAFASLDANTETLSFWSKRAAQAARRMRGSHFPPHWFLRELEREREEREPDEWKALLRLVGGDRSG